MTILKSNLSIQQQLDEANAKIAAMESKMASKNKVTFLLGKSGTICAYGLGKYPVALYQTQWASLVAAIGRGDLDAALTTHADLLASQSDTAVEAQAKQVKREALVAARSK